jgi:hypothetical protein
MRSSIGDELGDALGKRALFRLVAHALHDLVHQDADWRRPGSGVPRNCGCSSQLPNTRDLLPRTRPYGPLPVVDAVAPRTPGATLLSSIGVGRENAALNIVDVRNN